DCMPHRAWFVYVLVIAAWGCSLCLLLLPLQIIGLALGIIAWRLTAWDMAQMRAGRMVPPGWGYTKHAYDRARLAVVISVVPAVGWWFLVLALLCAFGQVLRCCSDCTLVEQLWFLVLVELPFLVVLCCVGYRVGVLAWRVRGFRTRAAPRVVLHYGSRLEVCW